mmetsp:Transcript_7279/g.23884  ORF Transcript_7279/g.23884 Transcript_7279/m.23884 type:complete len:287 (-) Transcript_7279:162-1022(-)
MLIAPMQMRARLTRKKGTNEREQVLSASLLRHEGLVRHLVVMRLVLGLLGLTGPRASRLGCGGGRRRRSAILLLVLGLLGRGRLGREHCLDFFRRLARGRILSLCLRHNRRRGGRSLAVLLGRRLGLLLGALLRRLGLASGLGLVLAFCGLQRCEKGVHLIQLCVLLRGLLRPTWQGRWFRGRAVGRGHHSRGSILVLVLVLALVLLLLVIIIVGVRTAAGLQPGWASETRRLAKERVIVIVAIGPVGGTGRGLQLVEAHPCGSGLRSGRRFLLCVASLLGSEHVV